MRPGYRWYDHPAIRPLALSTWAFRRKSWHPKARRLARWRSLYWTLLRLHDTEICGRCGGPVQLVFHVPDDYWIRACGTRNPPHGVLCPACFTDLAQDAGYPTPYWECGEGEFPSCVGSPCAHQESMMTIAAQREELWAELVALRASASPPGPPPE